MDDKEGTPAVGANKLPILGLTFAVFAYCLGLLVLASPVADGSSKREVPETTETVFLLPCVQVIR